MELNQESVTIRSLGNPKYLQMIHYVTTNPTDIKMIVKYHHEPLYANKFNNLHEMDKFPEN